AFNLQNQKAAAPISKFARRLCVYDCWSGRRGSNPQPLAWEANALPLSYSRSDLFDLSKSGRKLPQVIIGCNAPFNSPALGWSNPNVKTMLATKNFRPEPTNLVYLQHVN